jgi:RNA polymerase sigma factor (TIGR02999 family)
MKGERRGHTLSATALVHEAFLRLEGTELMRSSGSGAFYTAAAVAMRRILVEHARSRARVKRGGGAARIRLDEIGDVADLDAADEQHGEVILAFDDAFRRLEEHEPSVADVVRLRFFAGLTVAQVAAGLGLSERTVISRWAYARAWLASELEQRPQP